MKKRKDREWKNAPAQNKYKVTFTDFGQALHFKFLLKSSFAENNCQIYRNNSRFFRIFQMCQNVESLHIKGELGECLNLSNMKSQGTKMRLVLQKFNRILSFRVVHFHWGNEGDYLAMCQLHCKISAFIRDC